MQKVTGGKARIGKGAVTIVTDTTATVSSGGLSDGAGTTITVAAANAALGDIALVGPGVDMIGFTYSAYVSTPGSVAIRIQNESGAAGTPASSTWTVKVIR